MSLARRCGDAAASRHDIRAKLNHIAGYSELLRSDAEASGCADLVARYEAVRETAFSLVGPLMSLKADEPPERERGERIAADLRGAIRALIAEVEDVKLRAGVDFAAAADIDRILAAANEVLDAVPESSP
jgi:signal transduction histidine kinase